MYVYIRSEGKCDGKKATNMIVLSRRQYYIKGGGGGEALIVSLLVGGDDVHVCRTLLLSLVLLVLLHFCILFVIDK